MPVPRFGSYSITNLRFATVTHKKHTPEGSGSKSMCAEEYVRATSATKSCSSRGALMFTSFVKDKRPRWNVKYQNGARRSTKDPMLPRICFDRTVGQTLDTIFLRWVHPTSCAHRRRMLPWNRTQLVFDLLDQSRNQLEGFLRTRGGWRRFEPLEELRQALM